jgi:hypothetical protein
MAFRLAFVLLLMVPVGLPFGLLAYIWYRIINRGRYRLHALYGKCRYVAMHNARWVAAGWARGLGFGNSATFVGCELYKDGSKAVEVDTYCYTNGGTGDLR